MSIDFSAERWGQVRQTYRRWWAGELERPIIPVTLRNRAPERTCPDVPLLSQANCHRLDIPAEDIIDRIDYELSCHHFLGDAFPMVNLDSFGPGVIAMFMGAELDNHTGQVWFHPASKKSISELELRFDPDNPWFRRICDLIRAGKERWGDQVLIAFPDIGGNLDILATFCPGEQLLFDLMDESDEVKRVTWEVHEAWVQCFEALSKELQADTQGCSSWAGIYSEAPGYILQCDFAYMIGPDMFKEFALPELEASVKRMAYPFYHLDGPGALKHLPDLLQIESLRGVQWVPGAGAPDCSEWPGVYRQIRDAGKNIQLIGGFDVLEKVVGQLGSGRGIHLLGAVDGDADQAWVEQQLRRVEMDT